MSSPALSLRGKFLWLTVPAFCIAASVFLAFLLSQRQGELEQLRLSEARRQLERDAGLLAAPLWNLDLAAVAEVAGSAVADRRVRCARVHGVPGRVAPLEYGDCIAAGATQVIAVNVGRRSAEGEQRIGQLVHWVDVTVSTPELLAEARPMLAMFLLLLLVLVACVMLAFGRLILRPLQWVAASIQAQRSEGRYVAVPYRSGDELGQFIAAYNEGLERQRDARQRLQAQLRFQQALSDTLPLPLAVADAQFRVLEANPAFRRAFLGDAEPDGRQLLQQLLPGLDLPALRATQGVFEQELRLPAATGLREFALTATALPGADGEVPLWLAVLQDITARQEGARALQAAFAETRQALLQLQTTQASLMRAEKLASLGSVVAGIAHELNTPVGNSLTVASALGERIAAFRRSLVDGPVRRSQLDALLADAAEADAILMRSLQRVAAQVASFKQLAADQIQDQRRGFDLRAALHDMLSTLKPMLRERPIEVELQVDGDLYFDSYPGALAQVIGNLFSNAVQHGLEGREHGRIRVSASEVDAHHVELRFEDDGCGIAEADQQRLFDPFFTTKFGHGSNGLGLNLVYTMTTVHLGGRIAVESRPGKGTRFVLVLPRVAPWESGVVGEGHAHA